MADPVHFTYEVPVILRVQLSPKAARVLPAGTVRDVLTGAIGDQLDISSINRFIHNAIIRKETFQGDEIEVYDLTIAADSVKIITTPHEGDED